MSAYLKRNSALLKLLSKAQPRLRKVILCSAPNDLIRAIGEIALNALKRTLPLSQRQRNVLRRKRGVIKTLSCSKIPLTRKKKVIVQQDRFIGSLLGIALPLLTSFLRPS